MIKQLCCRNTCTEEPYQSHGVPSAHTAWACEASLSERPVPASRDSSRISRRDFLIWSAASTALVLGGRSRGLAEERPAIKVGFILPEHGDLAPEAQSLMSGFDLFLKEKGQDAPRLEILKNDPGADDAKTLEAVTDLAVNKEVTFLIGPPSLEGTQKTVEAAAEAKAVVFVTNPAVRFVAGEWCSKKTFSLRPNAYQAAQPLAPWALMKLGKRVFITGDDDSLGNAEADFFAQSFERSGGMFVDRVMAPAGSAYEKTVLAALAEAKPDFVFASFRGQSAAAFLKAYQAASPRLPMPVIGPESLTAFPQTLERVGKDCVGVRTLTTLKDPQQLVARIKEKLRRDVTDAARAAEGYDIAGIVCSVAAREPVETDPIKLSELIREMEIKGPRGTVRFDANHEPLVDAMVQEWASEGKGFKQTIVESLGVAKSLDFGCGRVGFPRRPQSEPKEEPVDESRGGDMIWEEESQ